MNYSCVYYFWYIFRVKISKLKFSEPLLKRLIMFECFLPFCNLESNKQRIWVIFNNEKMKLKHLKCTFNYYKRRKGNQNYKNKKITGNARTFLWSYYFIQNLLMEVFIHLHSIFVYVFWNRSIYLIFIILCNICYNKDEGLLYLRALSHVGRKFLFIVNVIDVDTIWELLPFFPWYFYVYLIGEMMNPMQQVQNLQFQQKLIKRYSRILIWMKLSRSLQ